MAIPHGGEGSPAPVGDGLTISVVIPTFQRANVLSRAVQPFTSDPAVAEIIIVDDGSDDGTPEVCAALARASDKVRVHRQPNQGEAAARAAGLDLSTSDIVLFVDDDVIANQGLASGHLRHHQAGGPPLVVVGYMPPLFPSPRRPGHFPTFLYSRDYELMCTRYEEDPGTILQNLWGGNLSARRDDCLSAVKVPGTLPYHADQLLGWRLSAAGCTGVFDRSLSAAHAYERTPAQFFHDCRRDVRALLLLESEGFSEAAHVLDGSLPHWQRSILRVLAGKRAAPARRLMRWALWGTGTCHIWILETWIARVLRQVVLSDERYHHTSATH
jgi:glycosyltransferase involved in cell wall biosynthesis